MKKTGEAGFSLLGVLVAVMIVGIMAGIAVPKLSGAITAANTAKIRSDLSTLDTAVVMYQMDKGANPTSLNNLSDYVDTNLKPPTGKCYLKSEGKDVSEEMISGTDEYTLGANNKEIRAMLKGHVQGDFGK